MLTDEQRERRIEGIGASESAIIMGYSHYKTKYQLYLEKIGVMQPDQTETEVQYWGNALEPAILKRFAEDNDVIMTFPDTVYHPKYPFIFANLDGWIESERAVVEAKSANSFQRKEWDMALTDGVPLMYLIQIAKQCAITDASRGYCAVLIGGMEYKQFIYERDAALEDLIIKADCEFWDCIQSRREPEMSNTADCRLKFPTPSPHKIAHSTFQTAKALVGLARVKASIKQLNEEEDAFKMQIMEQMRDAEYLVGLNEELLATWKATKKGHRVFNVK